MRRVKARRRRAPPDQPELKGFSDLWPSCADRSISVESTVIIGTDGLSESNLALGTRDSLEAETEIEGEVDPVVGSPDGGNIADGLAGGGCRDELKCGAYAKIAVLVKEVADGA